MALHSVQLPRGVCGARRANFIVCHIRPVAGMDPLHAGDNMTENAFDGLLCTIITQHREAERNRRLWLRIWAIMALSIAVLIGAGWYSVAQAQAAATAYEGDGIAWDYPTGVVNHAGFRLTIDGVTGNTQIAKDARQLRLADTVLKGQPVGKTYTIRLVATATAPAVNSAPAVLAINYQARPQLAPPTKVRAVP